MTNREIFVLIGHEGFHRNEHAVAGVVRELARRELQRMNPTHGFDPCTFDIDSQGLCRYATRGCTSAHERSLLVGAPR